jgi:hypothetical protein
MSLKTSVMRPLILASAIAAALLGVPAASAAPTCQDSNGETIKCGIQGAMPVGWTLSPQQRLERQISRPAYPSVEKLLETICVVGMFFALMALMPDFDGSRTGDWGEEEDRDERG